MAPGLHAKWCAFHLRACNLQKYMKHQLNPKPLLPRDLPRAAGHKTLKQDLYRRLSMKANVIPRKCNYDAGPSLRTGSSTRSPLTTPLKPKKETTVQILQCKRPELQPLSRQTTSSNLRCKHATPQNPILSFVLGGSGCFGFFQNINDKDLNPIQLFRGGKEQPVRVRLSVSWFALVDT